MSGLRWQLNKEETLCMRSCMSGFLLQMQLWVRKVCSQRVSHATNPSLFFFPFSPQALQPHTEKARRAQGTGQRAELPVYSCQNTGGWVNLLCATGSIAEHFDGRVCHCL